MTDLNSFDASIRRIAEYVVATTASDVTAAARDGLVRHHLDSIGCALGAYPSSVCQVMRAIAATAQSPTGASVIGLPDRTTPEYATFANSTMVRFLDFNDNYLHNGGGHTSDLIPAVFAAAEQQRRSGLDFLVGLHVAYEMLAGLADGVFMRPKGWDYPAFVGIAAAASAAKMMDLPADQVANAVAMAITPNLPLGITRVGPLSNWKALASSYATMGGFFAARLASHGITGPPQAFEGHRGLWDLATGPFPLDHLGQPVDGLSAVERSNYKLFVADGNAQGPVGVFVDLNREGVKAEEIASIHIRTYEVAWSEIGGGQDDHANKWDPQNKETADHSLPYMVTVALVHGDVTAESYDDMRVRDLSLRPIMAKISVEPDPQLTAVWNTVPAHEIEITFVDGRRRNIRSTAAKGTPQNPASDDDLVQKFRRQAVPVFGVAQTDRVLDRLWSVPELAAVTSLADDLRGLVPWQGMGNNGRLNAGP